MWWSFGCLCEHKRNINVMLCIAVTYSETLPVEAPPSYRGVTLKYSYKVTIGAQRFGCHTKLLRLPFRVLVVPGYYI